MKLYSWQFSSYQNIGGVDVAKIYYFSCLILAKFNYLHSLTSETGTISDKFLTLRLIMTSGAPAYS